MRYSNLINVLDHNIEILALRSSNCSDRHLPSLVLKLQWYQQQDLPFWDRLFTKMPLRLAHRLTNARLVGLARCEAGRVMTYQKIKSWGIPFGSRFWTIFGKNSLAGSNEQGCRIFQRALRTYLEYGRRTHADERGRPPLNRPPSPRWCPHHPRPGPGHQ